MITLYIKFKNKEDLEIEDVIKTEFLEMLAEFVARDGKLFYYAGYIINLDEINYMEFIEGDMENENI